MNDEFIRNTLGKWWSSQSTQSVHMYKYRPICELVLPPKPCLLTITRLNIWHYRWMHTDMCVSKLYPQTHYRLRADLWIFHKTSPLLTANSSKFLHEYLLQFHTEATKSQLNCRTQLPDIHLIFSNSNSSSDLSSRTTFPAHCSHSSFIFRWTSSSSIPQYTC